MTDIFEQIQESMNRLLREGEDAHIELIQSEIHECEEKGDSRVIFYVTPENILKYNTNIQSFISMAPGTPVKCCMWCGFSLKKECVK